MFGGACRSRSTIRHSARDYENLADGVLAEKIKDARFQVTDSFRKLYGIITASEDNSFKLEALTAEQARRNNLVKLEVESLRAQQKLHDGQRVDRVKHLLPAPLPAIDADVKAERSNKREKKREREEPAKDDKESRRKEREREQRASSSSSTSTPSTTVAPSTDATPSKKPSKIDDVIQEAQKKQKRSILDKVGAVGLSKEDRSQLLRSLQDLIAKDVNKGDDTDPEEGEDVLSILGVEKSDVEV